MLTSRVGVVQPPAFDPGLARKNHRSVFFFLVAGTHFHSGMRELWRVRNSVARHAPGRSKGVLRAETQNTGSDELERERVGVQVPYRRFTGYLGVWASSEGLFD